MTEGSSPARRFSIDAGALVWLWLTALIIGLDQWTKKLILDHM